MQGDSKNHTGWVCVGMSLTSYLHDFNKFNNSTSTWKGSGKQFDQKY